MRIKLAGSANGCRAKGGRIPAGWPASRVGLPLYQIDFKGLIGGIIQSI